MPQSLSELNVHLVFSTKHRKPMLLSPVREDLHAYLVAVLNNQDSPALKAGGMSDHIHALFRLSKKGTTCGLQANPSTAMVVLARAI